MGIFVQLPPQPQTVTGRSGMFQAMLWGQGWGGSPLRSFRPVGVGTSAISPISRPQVGSSCRQGADPQRGPCQLWGILVEAAGLVPVAGGASGWGSAVEGSISSFHPLWASCPRKWLPHHPLRTPSRFPLPHSAPLPFAGEQKVIPLENSLLTLSTAKCSWERVSPLPVVGRVWC